MGVFKNTIFFNLNQLTAFSHQNRSQEIPKKFQLSRWSGTIPTGTPKSGSCPFISEEKKSFEYRVHGIQNDRLRLTVSTQKFVLKNMHRVPRYYQKGVQNQPSKPRGQSHFQVCQWELFQTTQRAEIFFGTSYDLI